MFKVLGWIILVLTGLFIASWVCHAIALAVGATANTTPVQSVGELISVFFKMSVVVVCGVLAYPYVIVHAMMPVDLLVVASGIAVGSAGAFGHRLRGSSGHSSVSHH